MNKEIPEHIAKSFADWKRMAVWLRLTFLLLVVASVVCSLVVTTFTAELSPIGLKSFSFAAALSVAMLTSIDIAGKANRVRQAVPQFGAALMRFDTKDDFTIEQLISAYELSEYLVGDVNYIPQKTTKQDDQS